MRSVSSPPEAAHTKVGATASPLCSQHILARTDRSRRATREGAHRTDSTDGRLHSAPRRPQDLQRLSGNITTAMANVAAVNTQRATLREDYRAQLEQPVTTGP